MKADSIAYIVAGMCFGVMLGWLIGSQQSARSAPAPAQTAAAPQSGQQQRQPPPLDETRVQELTKAIDSDPKNAKAVTELANVYFDAERFDDAIRWYQQALALDPNNADVSTDLGISYYYTSRTDQALRQFEHSLEVSPKHVKTLLNKGIVLAFGKEDLGAAAEEWKKVVELAPDSPEGQTARRALEGIAAAHAERSKAAGNP
jgi:Tfp pilus assembly protein PilF